MRRDEHRDIVRGGTTESVDDVVDTERRACRGGHRSLVLGSVHHKSQEHMFLVYTWFHLPSLDNLHVCYRWANEGHCAE